MHDLGLDDEQVRKLIQIRNDKVEKLCNEIQDTIIIIIADHGHKEHKSQHAGYSDDEIYVPLIVVGKT